MQIIQVLLDGVTLAGVYFLIASGFTLIFGLMRIANLAHGALYLVGGYIGYSVAQRTSGNIALAVIVAALIVGILGVVIERVLLRLVRGDQLPEVLMTVGIAYILADQSLVIWGGTPKIVLTPSYMNGSVHLGALTYPTIRFWVLGIAAVIALGLWLFTERTRIGAIIRAGVDDAEMVAGLGINIRAVFSSVFFLGAALAGVSGVIGAALLSVNPGDDSIYLLYGLVVVIIGGLGSLQGAIIGSLLVGLTYAAGTTYFPQFAEFTIFGPMVLMLALRPQGLFGRKQ